MKPRRQTIFKVLLLLIAGATLNVAVAWACCLSSARLHLFTRDISSDEVDALVDAGFESQFLSNPTRSIIKEETANGLGVCYVSTYEEVAYRSIDRFVMNIPICLSLQSGWPVPAMQGMCHAEKAFSRDPYHRGHVLLFLRSVCGSPIIQNGTYLNAIALPERSPSLTDQTCRMLPVRPLWPGFAINTLFYAGVLWMLCCGPFALRRMIRRRRGCCAACAYPIGSSAVCTECGAALSPRRGAGV